MGTGAWSQAEEPLMVDVSSCIDVESHLERLTCYDDLAGLKLNAARTAEEVQSESSTAEAETTATAPVAVAAEPAPVAATAAVTEENFGLKTEEEDVAVTEENYGLRVKKDKEGDVVELFSTISSLKERVPGRYLITLENGQVWYQEIAHRYKMRVGDDVRIYPSGWGESFRMTVVDQSGFIQVKRVQ